MLAAHDRIETIAIDMVDGLPRSRLRPFTADEWGRLPHFVLTEASWWNPCVLDHCASHYGRPTMMVPYAGGMYDGRGRRPRQERSTVGRMALWGVVLATVWCIGAHVGRLVALKEGPMSAVESLWRGPLGALNDFLE